MEMTRPSKEQYYMQIARAVSVRSNCIRRQIGAVIVVDDRIVATGYNGTPRGMRNCFDGGCPRCNNQGESKTGQNLGECLCIHAEENCIVSAAYHGGTRLRNGVLYTMLSPCLICAKLILNASLSVVIYENLYPLNGLQLLQKAGIHIHNIHLEKPMTRKIRTDSGKMRIDNKHHIEMDRIIKTSNGDPISDEEPRILFRGRDRLALPMLRYYRELCVKDGATDYQLENLDGMIEEFEEFSSQHPEVMKQPGITRGA